MFIFSQFFSFARFSSITHNTNQFKLHSWYLVLGSCTGQHSSVESSGQVDDCAFVVFYLVSRLLGLVGVLLLDFCWLSPCFQSTLPNGSCRRKAEL